MTAELKSWLDTKFMGHFAYIFIQNGYCEPADLLPCSQSEIETLLSQIPKPGHRLKVRVMIEDLKRNFLEKEATNVTNRKI